MGVMFDVLEMDLVCLFLLVAAGRKLNFASYLAKRLHQNFVRDFTKFRVINKINRQGGTKTFLGNNHENSLASTFFWYVSANLMLFL